MVSGAAVSISTYTELQAAVANWLARDDLTARIPEWVALFEAKANRTIFHRSMEARSTATIDTETDEPEMISLPSDFQTMRRVRLSSVAGKPRLEFKSGAQIDEYRTSIGNASGQPGYFSIFGTEMELIPTPDAAYTIEMVYRANIPALGATNATNWLLTNHPDAYLYGALLESAPYMKEDSRIQTWALGLGTTIDAINNVGMASTYNAGPMQMRVSGATP